jgi:hypothetical protein
MQVSYYSSYGNNYLYYMDSYDLNSHTMAEPKLLAHIRQNRLSEVRSRTADNRWPEHATACSSASDGAAGICFTSAAPPPHPIRKREKHCVHFDLLFFT